MNVEIIPGANAGDASTRYRITLDDGSTYDLFRDEIDALALAVCRHDAERAAALLPQVTP